MTYPNKNFMVDSSCFVVVSPFFPLFLPNPENFLFRNAFAVAARSTDARPPATHHSRSSARFSGESSIFGCSLAPSLSRTLSDVGEVYVLPGQRAYRSVQTTEFFLLMLFPSTFRFFISRRPPSSRRLSLSSSFPTAAHSLWKYFRCFFAFRNTTHFGIMRQAGRHTDK